MANEKQDTWIAKAQFDSKDFDSNIRKSQKSLQDFKKELNFDDAVRQMEGVAGKNGILESMANNLKKLTNEIAGIGNISTFIQQKIKGAWQGAANSVQSFVNSLTVAQKEAGAQKYDRVLKAVQTIKNATGDTEDYVYGVLQNLTTYTDETSYSFTEMADSISKFTTAGVGLKDAEKELEGVANWAALAGQGVQEANRAMYNISQAMSAGYMLKIDYKSIMNANMDIRKFREEALKAAEEVGTLIGKNGKYRTKKGNKEVNIDNFADTLKYQWFDKATMEKVFKTFGDNTKGIGKEAYKAAQRCVTFSDALNAIKDMLSSGWMRTYEAIFGKLSDAMALFSGLCNKAEEALAKFMDLRNGVLEKWSFTGRDSLWGALVGEIESPDGETLFAGAYGLLDILSDLGDQFYNAFWDLAKKFIAGENAALWDNDPEYRFNMLAAGLSELTRKVQEFVTGIRDFMTEIPIGQTESRFDQIRHVIESIFSAILLVVQVIKGIGQFIGEVISQLQPATDAITYLFGYLSQLFTGKIVRGAKTNAIGNFFHGLAEILRPFTTIVNAVVITMVNLIGKVSQFLNQSGLLQFMGKLFQSLVSLVVSGFSKFSSKVLAPMLNWIQNVSQNIPGSIAKLKAFGKSILDSIKSSRTFTNFWGWVTRTFGGKTLKDVWNNIRTGFNGLISQIPMIIPTMKDKLGSVWSSVVTVLDNFFGNIIGFFVGSAKADEASETINEGIINVLTPGVSKSGKENTSASLLDRIKNAVNGIWEPIKGFFTKLFSEDIPNFFNSPAIKSMGKFFEGTTFTGLLSGITNLVRWLAVFKTGSGLVSMGKGVKKLGIGLKVFGKNLKNLNLVGAFKDMFNFTNIVNSNNTDNSRTNNWGKFGGQLLKIALAVGIVTQAAVKLSEMKTDDLKKAGLSLAAMLAGLLAADVVARKFGGGGSGILKMAAGVTLLLIPLNKLMAMPWGALGQGGVIDGIAKLGLMLTSMSLAIKLAGKNGPKGFVSMAVGLNLMLHPLRQLMQMPLFKGDGSFDWNGLPKAISALLVLMLGMGGAARLAGKGAKGLLALSIGMWILVRQVQAMAEMDIYKLAQGVGAMEILILSLGGLVAVAQGQKLASLAGVVLALSALSAIAMLIGKSMTWEQALIGFGPIVALLGSMALLLASAKGLQTEQIKALKTIFVAFAATVLVIAAAIVALSVLDVDWKTAVLPFFAGLILTLGSLGYLLKQASKVDAKTMRNLALVFGLFTLVIGAIVAGLWIIGEKGLDWKVVLSFVGGLTALIGVLGLTLPALSKMDLTGALIAVGTMAAVVAAIMGVIGLMADWLLGQVGNAITNISARLKTVSGLLADFFDRMEEISDESVRHAGEVFDSVKDIIMKFVGFGDHQADISSVMSQLSMLGTGLDLFFVNDGSYPNPEQSQSFKILQKFVDIQPSLAAFSVGNLPSELMYLGVGIALFHSATQNIQDENVPALGLLKGIFGQADNIEKFTRLPLEEFSAQMSGLGGAMSLYAAGAKEVTGIDAETDAPDITSAIGILKAVCDSISGADGTGAFVIPENMPGSTELGLFAGQLQSLGSALSTFATAAHEMETDTGNALALLEFLGQLGGYVTTDSLGVIGVFDAAGVHAGEGSGTLGQFALDIGALGTALSDFAGNVKEKDFSGGLAALDHFQLLNRRLTADNLAFTKAFNEAQVHDTQLGTFSTDIGALGRALKSFAQNVTMDDGTQADFNYALRALSFMAKLQTRLSEDLPKIGGLHELWDGQAQSLGSLSTDVQLIGQALRDFSDAMAGVGEDSGVFNFDAVMSGFNALSKLIDIVNQMTALDPGTGQVYGADFFVRNLAIMTASMNDAEYLTRNGYGNGKTVAQNLAEFCRQLSDALAEAGGLNADSLLTLSSVIDSIVNLSTIDQSIDLTGPGLTIASKIAEGIRKGSEEISLAASEVIRAALEAAELAAQTGLTAEDGSALNLLSLINDTMGDELNLTPTITPVLCLNDVELGMAQLDEYFNGYKLNLNGALDRASQAGGYGPTEVTVTNPTDLSGINSALSTLQTQIGQLETAIGNIKIVLNTGVVAGGVANDIDVNFARRMLFNSRRN